MKKRVLIVGFDGMVFNLSGTPVALMDRDALAAMGKKRRLVSSDGSVFFNEGNVFLSQPTEGGLPKFGLVESNSPEK